MKDFDAFEGEKLKTWIIVCIRALSEAHYSLDGLDWKALRDEGRR